jgi:hypothetical protein
MTKNRKKFKVKKIGKKFWFKNYNLPIPRPPGKAHPSYKRNLQLSKKNIQHFKA